MQLPPMRSIVNRGAHAATACARALQSIARVALGVLREIGDEHAYARYLRLHGRPHSREMWQQFSDERLRAKYVRPKCC